MLTLLPLPSHASGLHRHTGGARCHTNMSDIIPEICSLRALVCCENVQIYFIHEHNPQFFWFPSCFPSWLLLPKFQFHLLDHRTTCLRCSSPQRDGSHANCESKGSLCVRFHLSEKLVHFYLCIKCGVTVWIIVTGGEISLQLVCVSVGDGDRAEFASLSVR